MDCAPGAVSGFGQFDLGAPGWPNVDRAFSRLRHRFRETSTIPPDWRAESATRRARSATVAKPRSRIMGRKFAIACLIAIAIGAAAGFAMPADAATLLAF
jgi:hypothetical protein